MNNYTITINLRVQAENVQDAVSISDAYVNEINQLNDCNAKLCTMYKNSNDFKAPTCIFDNELELQAVKYYIYKLKKKQ